MDLTILPKELEDIILTNVCQIEHVQKFQKCLEKINNMSYEIEEGCGGYMYSKKIYQSKKGKIITECHNDHRHNFISERLNGYWDRTEIYREYNQYIELPAEDFINVDIGIFDVEHNEWSNINNPEYVKYKNDDAYIDCGNGCFLLKRQYYVEYDF